MPKRRRWTGRDQRRENRDDDRAKEKRAPLLKKGKQKSKK
jgi:hypothetical protein|tara:strand:+ start:506 stop:625 length:120 start_codon:yes stop_codon:yes gene_type:complete